MSDCIFCRIVAGELPSQVVYEDEDILAFKDVYQQAPVHVLAIPKKHIPSLVEAADTDRDLVGRLIWVLKRVAADSGLDGGYRLVNSNGPEGGQTVGHLHFHLLGGRRLKWPPG